MTTAELIFWVLKIDATTVWPKEAADDPMPPEWQEVDQYLIALRARYASYRRSMDFAAAEQKARTQTIQAILDRADESAT